MKGKGGKKNKDGDGVAACINCFFLIVTGAPFCTRCGSDQTDRTACPRCGDLNPIHDDSWYCIGCGAALWKGSGSGKKGAGDGGKKKKRKSPPRGAEGGTGGASSSSSGRRAHSPDRPPDRSNRDKDKEEVPKYHGAKEKDGSDNTHCYYCDLEFGRNLSSCQPHSVKGRHEYPKGQLHSGCCRAEHLEEHLSGMPQNGLRKIATALNEELRKIKSGERGPEATG